MRDNRCKIGEFADLLGVSKATIYKWEREGKLPKPNRQQRGTVGYRYYSIEDVSKTRKLLNLPSLVKGHRRQLFLNFKGGTGKSVTSANYGYRLAQHGLRVLMVDLDPQGHLTVCLGINPEGFNKTLYDVIINRMPIQEVIVSTSLPTLDLIPANLDLSPLELALTSFHAREYKIKRALDQVINLYDLIIMDAPPNIGLVNLNAILTADDLFVPVLADFLSYHGLKIFFDTLSNIEVEFSHNLDSIYIVINRFNPSENISIRSREAIKQHYPKFTLDTVIRQNITISDATARQKSIFEIAPFSRGARDINRLIKEVFKLNERRV